MEASSINPADKLYQLTEDSFTRLNSLFPDDMVVSMTIAVCRTMDFYFALPKPDSEEQQRAAETFHDHLKMGFPVLLHHFYKNKNADYADALAPSDNYSEVLSDESLRLAGKLASVQQLVQHCKSDLLDISEITPNHFQVKHKHKDTAVEYLENMSLRHYYKSIYKQIAGPVLKQLRKKEAGVLLEMKPLVTRKFTHFITYGTTPEIDRYFDKMAYANLITSQLYDMFEGTAIFGGITYEKYIRVLQSLIGTGLKHLSYCGILIQRYPEMNFRNIACIWYNLEELIPQYADYLGYTENEIRQIFDCFTVSADNIDFHVTNQKSFSPIFIRVSPTHVMRSVYGSQHKPLMFLLRELKRRFLKDYDNNTDREKIFRQQLYNLIFQRSVFKNKLLTTDRGVIINIEGMRTDIDAAVYDTKTKNLALFQLKWQDLFAHDWKDRRNKLKEFKKAELWVEKMKKWSSTRTAKDILSALHLLKRIPNGAFDINNIYIFVLNRYNAHFTGFKPNEDAAWASWYLLQEVAETGKEKMKDPLQELHTNIKNNSPRNKSIFDYLEDYEIDLKTYKVSFSAIRPEESNAINP